ncbi:alpha/beta fold hydrolase [Thiomicrorhabdus sp. 6S2-11]|uniref:Alpha/beta fold hydrolase n=1 Tax=Thiomicrorhabdus marina TaxID=2818442 RepID=A0ABS3Q5X8_9GAMM|nr:alpha/beta fold hydrolase [Thiomicrorhabdus marina]
MRTKKKTQLIEGPAGLIEVEVVPAKKQLSQDGSQNLAIISHPHPLYGGTMDNKVVTTLFKAYQELGFNVVRYNFRGVGASEGEHDYAQGELNDLLAVVDWAQQPFPESALHLAGFSFGSYIAFKAAAQLKPKSLLTVAPPVGLYSFEPEVTGQLDKDTQWSLLQGGQDEVVESAQVLNWARALAEKPDIYWREKASHFFHGELIWLRRAVLLAYS